MKTILILALAVGAAGAAGPSGPAPVELRIRDTRWEQGIKVQGKALRYEEMKEWSQRPGDKAPGPVRFTVTVENAGKEVVDGVVVRFALSARISPIAGGGAIWAIPFELGEHRIPMLKPGESRSIPLLPIHIPSYLRRQAAQGFWPEAFKLQMMVDPKAGDTLDSNIQESILPVKR